MFLSFFFPLFSFACGLKHTGACGATSEVLTNDCNICACAIRVWRVNPIPNNQTLNFWLPHTAPNDEQPQTSNNMCFMLIDASVCVYVIHSS